MGKDEDTIIERARQMRGPLPDKILNAPEILPGLELYINAFNILSRGRIRGEGFVGPIPYESISRYLKDYGIEGGSWDSALEILTQMDEAYCKWQTDHMKKLRDAAKSASASKAPAGRRRR